MMLVLFMFVNNQIQVIILRTDQYYQEIHFFLLIFHSNTNDISNKSVKSLSCFVVEMYSLDSKLDDSINFPDPSANYILKMKLEIMVLMNLFG